MTCDYLGNYGPCRAPAIFRGTFIVPAGKPFARCHAHLGHLSPTERVTGKGWRAYELPTERRDRKALEAATAGGEVRT